ncbi:MAG: hypothetical protein M3Z20_18830 [Chloroflexota bacterium]|nr:hypothetical protein [Chloroflexota bacterium]
MSTGMIEATAAPTDHAWRFHDREAGDDAFVALAATLGSVFASLPAEHDRESAFVCENFDRMRDTEARLTLPCALREATLRRQWPPSMPDPVASLDELEDEYVPDDRAMAPLMIAKRQIVTGAQEIVIPAMEVVGGSSYLALSVFERGYRNVRAGAFHPLNPERSRAYVGRLTPGVPADTIW